MRRPRNTFNAKSSLVVNGRKMKNMFEEQIYKEALKEAPEGSSVHYETEKIPYVISHSYIPDLPIVLPNGKKFYIEIKGNGRAWTPEVRRKMIQAREQNPDIDVRFVFYSDGKFGTRRKNGTLQTQSEWAEKNGFKYSIGRIPKEWFDTDS